MQTVIYADVLVAVNTFVTYFILVCARVVSKIGTGRLGAAAASLAGGFSALIILAGDIGPVLSLGYKLLTAAVICLLGFMPRSFKAFFKSLAAFFAVSFAFGGVCFAAECIFHPRGLVYRNGTVYFDVSVFSIAVFTLLCYGLTLIFDRLLKRRAADNTLYTLTVVFRNKSISVKALYDTGNSMCDALSGNPVTILNINAASALFSYDELVFLKRGSLDGEGIPESFKKHLRLTPCAGVCGSRLLKAFVPEKIIISDGKTVCESTCCTVALADSAADGEFEAILNSAVFERSKRVNENKNENRIFN